MALENAQNAINALAAAADAVLAKLASDGAALAQAQSDIAGLDAQITASVQPITDKLNASVAPPPADPAPAA